MTPNPYAPNGRAALSRLAARRSVVLPPRHGHTVTIDPTTGQAQMAGAFLDQDPLAAVIGTHQGRPVVRGMLGGGRAGAGNTPPDTWPRHDTILTRGGGMADLTERMRDGEHWFLATWPGPRQRITVELEDPPGLPAIRPAPGRSGGLAARIAAHDAAHPGPDVNLGAALRSLAVIADRDDGTGRAEVAVASRLAQLAAHAGAEPASLPAAPEGLAPGAPYDRVAVIAFGLDADLPSVVVGPLPRADARALARWLAGVSA